MISQTIEQEKPLSRRAITISQALRSRTVLLLVSAAFLQYLIGYSVIFWLPTILKNQSGLSDAQVGLFGALPYLLALFAMLFNGWHSDKCRERRWHAAVPLFIAAIGFLCLISLSSSNVMTVSFLSVISMAMAFLPVFWAPFQRKSSVTPRRHLPWESSMRSPVSLVLQDRTPLDTSGLKPDRS